VVYGLALVVFVMATACGDTSSDDAQPAATSTTATEQGPFPRTVRHAMGETTILSPPRRVVVLDTGELDAAIALGVVPVGAVRAPVESGFLRYLRPKAMGTELVGTITDPNLERVAALRPDLILSSKVRHAALYPKLAQIAPTVFTETVGVVWKQNLRANAEALGLEKKADQLLASYEARAKELGQRLASRGALPTVSVVRFLEGETRLYQKASFIGTVLSDVGLPRPPAQDVNAFRVNIGPEQVEMAAGDVIFHASYGPSDKTTKPLITSSPLWSQLAAVKGGRIYEVDDDQWMTGIGVLAANLVLDDIGRLLGVPGS
jgi:iron complex transport system substrate-binding protein